MKHIIATLLLLIGVYAQGQSMYFQVDSTFSYLKLTPSGMENPLYTHTMNKKVNSEISLTLQGELQLKQWIKSTLQEVFGSFPLNDEKVRLLKGVTINIGFSPQLKVIYYEYRVEKEVFDRFIKHEEDFFHLGKAFLAEDMNRYFKILYPDLYHYCAYSFPLGTVYKIWCLQ